MLCYIISFNLLSSDHVTRNAQKMLAHIAMTFVLGFNKNGIRVFSILNYS